jgi:hypothetical protein
MLHDNNNNSNSGCSQLVLLLLSAVWFSSPSAYCLAYFVPPPAFSRATKLPNEIYEWRGQKIRYQVAEPVTGTSAASAPTVILIHGLFVNSDHWRKTLKGLSEAGYRAYAIDLLGCGYSSKPPRMSMEATMLNGENSRFFDESRAGVSRIDEADTSSAKSKNQKYQSILHDVTLGTSSGKFYNVWLARHRFSAYD